MSDQKPIPIQPGYVRINDPDKKGDYLVIHSRDFDADVHVPFGEKPQRQLQQRGDESRPKGKGAKADESKPKGDEPAGALDLGTGGAEGAVAGADAAAV